MKAKVTQRKRKGSTRSKLAQARNSNLRYTQLNVLVNVHEHKAIADAAYKARVTMAEYVRRAALGVGRIIGRDAGASEASEAANAAERSGQDAAEQPERDRNELWSHAGPCLQRDGLPCTCGAFEHNARIYGEMGDEQPQPIAAQGANE